MKYPIRFTKKSFYSDSESFLYGSVEADTFEEAKERADMLGLKIEVRLSTSLIVKREIMNEGKWIEW